MPERRLPTLAEQAFEAALDDALWESWAERVRTEFAAQALIFAVADVGHATMCCDLWIGDSADQARHEYFEGVGALDPQFKMVLRNRPCGVFRDHDYVDLTDPGTREYLDWQVSRAGVRYGLTAAYFFDQNFGIGLALHRSVEAGPFTDDEYRRLQELYPHFVSAARLGFRHRQLLREAWWEGEQNSDSKAAILLDRRGSVLQVSRAAAEIISAGDGLTIKADELTASKAEDHDLLRRLIHHAVARESPSPGAAMIARPSGRKAYEVFTYPLPAKRSLLAPFEAAVLIHVVDPTRPAHHVTVVQKALFGLSERETEVADLLLAGHSPESLAATLAISPNTAKVHLRGLFLKTGTNRQCDLVRLLLDAS